jgi:hypothetical protein
MARDRATFAMVKNFLSSHSIAWSNEVDMVQVTSAAGVTAWVLNLEPVVQRFLEDKPIDDDFCKEMKKLYKEKIAMEITMNNSFTAGAASSTDGSSTGSNGIGDNNIHTQTATTGKMKKYFSKMKKGLKRLSGLTA